MFYKLLQNWQFLAFLAFVLLIVFAAAFARFNREMHAMFDDPEGRGLSDAGIKTGISSAALLVAFILAALAAWLRW